MPISFSPRVRAGLGVLAAALAAVVATVPSAEARVAAGVLLTVLASAGIVPPQVKA